MGGGAYDLRKTRRPLADVLPNGVTWIQAAVSEVLPDEQTLLLDSGQRVSWQHLIVCPGLRLAWEDIEGLQADPRPARRHLQLQLRIRRLHLATGAAAQGRQGDLYPAGHADQMRRRAAESHVPVL